jgi:hypothetical protein
MVQCLEEDEASLTCDSINNTHKSHWWLDKNPHDIVETNFQHCFSVNVWCGVIEGQLTGPAVLPNGLTGHKYVDFLQNDLQLLLEEVPLAERMCMAFQHDGAAAHYRHWVTYLLHGAESFLGGGNWDRVSGQQESDI